MNVVHEWDYMGLYGIIWDYMRIIWDYMGLYGIIWDYMGLYGIIWLYPLVNCYITMENHCVS